MTAWDARRLWTIQDVSDYLGVPVKTLYRWRTTGYGPRARKVGRHLRSKKEDVLAWVDTCGGDNGVAV